MFTYALTRRSTGQLESQLAQKKEKQTYTNNKTQGKVPPVRRRSTLHCAIQLRNNIHRYSLKTYMKYARFLAFEMMQLWSPFFWHVAPHHWVKSQEFNRPWRILSLGGNSTPKVRPLRFSRNVLRPNWEGATSQTNEDPIVYPDVLHFPKQGDNPTNIAPHMMSTVIITYNIWRHTRCENRRSKRV